MLSFAEYLALFAQSPAAFSRDASRYLRDAFDHFGVDEVERPWGTERRYRLFDQAFATGEQTLFGQEPIQAAIAAVLDGFVREGRANRLVLLHGPNGSAKTTVVRCLMHALEAYSKTDEGALYRFSWVFPRGADGGNIGFGDTASDGDESYAHLPEHRVAARLPSELRENPLLLLPPDARSEFLSSNLGDVSRAPISLRDGEISHKNQQIFQALLTAYRGDLARVYQHISVERYYISKRYRVGAITIGPEMAVDARERQITADRSVGSLPASLSAISLFESFGELVDGAAGLIEFSDLLKRPLEAWKYLLLAIENGEVALPFSTMSIDSVMVASSNELHLNAFRQVPDFNSFRGRLVLVRVPYLRTVTDERAIYDTQILPQVTQHVAPHTAYVAALWAVLTRLRRARADRYVDPEVGRIAADLMPIEKAELYARGVVPLRLSADDAKRLASSIDKVYDEAQEGVSYEGLTGASPREIRMLLLEAAADPDAECLHPALVLSRIAAFCERDDYAFLHDDIDRGYGDHAGFVKIARERWLDLVDRELRAATGLVDESQYLTLFERYVAHVANHVKGERVENAVTGNSEDADAELMERVEKMIQAGDDPNFRADLIGRVAGFAIDHPDQDVDYVTLFPRYIARLKESYFGERREQIAIIARDTLALLSGARIESLDPDRAARASATREALHRASYNDTSARIALAELVAERYSP